LNVEDSLDQLSERASKFFVNIHNKSSNAVYVFPGGTTPILFFNKIANNIKDWKSTTLILSDERMVDKDNSLSNAYHLNKNLINQINNLKLPKFLTFEEFMNPDFNKINKSFDHELSNINKPTFTLLGFGKDGHIASLFPNNFNLNKNKDDQYEVIKNDFDNFYRVSLTLNYLTQSKNIGFIISGKEKSESLKKSLFKPYNPVKRPLQYLIKTHKNKINIFCDKEAASGVINEIA
jgi:6-phosphogluconolactonase